MKRLLRPMPKTVHLMKLWPRRNAHLELLDGGSAPNGEKEAERRRTKREQMEIRLAAYEAQRSYRDE